MEFIGGLLLLFGAFVFPIVLIIGLIKPSLFKTPDKSPASRKQIAIVSVVGSLLCVGIGGALLPSEDTSKTGDENAVDTVVATESEPVQGVVADEAESAVEAEQVTEIEAEADNNVVEKQGLPDFGMTSDEFVKRYNALVVPIDKNWVINGIENEQSVTYAPMPNNIGMTGVVSDNGQLRGLILALSGSADAAANAQVLVVSVAAANAVNKVAKKEDVSKAVTDLIPAAIEHEGESQSRVVGNVKYAANYIPSLGGVFFTIDAVE